MPVKSRREEYSQETRGALVAAARPLFAERGYAGTSVDEIARAARVTKGALYHHFATKQDLFARVLEELHGELMQRVAAEAMTRADPWERMERGVGAFLDGCLDPGFRRIVLQDAPAVLGWERWRQIDERYALGLVREGLEELIEAGRLVAQPVDLLARVLLGAMTEAAMTIANARDEKRARRDAGDLLLRFLGCLRTPPAG